MPIHRCWKYLCQDIQKALDEWVPAGSAADLLRDFSLESLNETLTHETNSSGVMRKHQMSALKKTEEGSEERKNGIHYTALLELQRIGNDDVSSHTHRVIQDDDKSYDMYCRTQTIHRDQDAKKTNLGETRVFYTTNIRRRHALWNKDEKLV